jgi:HlyD family secretion protein
MSKRAAALWIAVVIGASFIASYWIFNKIVEPPEFRVSGVLEADDIHVGSKVGGRVVKVVARRGERVKAGDAIVVLDAAELRASLDEAQASLRESQAKLAELSSGYRQEEIDQARADWLATKAIHENSERFSRRMKDLAAREMVARQEYDDARTRAEEAEQRAKAARERYDLVKAGRRQEEIAQAQARKEMAEARVALLRAQLDETVVYAPVDSFVEVLDLEPGDLVPAGRPVATLLRAGSPWARVYVPEGRLGHVRPGLKVRVRVDSFPDKIFTGVVRRVNHQAEFTPRNVQTTEERVLQLFQAEVAIEDEAGVLRPGMSADVVIPLRSP